MGRQTLKVVVVVAMAKETVRLLVVVGRAVWWLVVGEETGWQRAVGVGAIV